MNLSTSLCCPCFPRLIMPVWRGRFAGLTLLFALQLWLEGSAAMAQRPVGTDVSHWQGSGVNWVNVKNAGVSFAWCKATESDFYKDATLATNMFKAKVAGVPIGAYHFARPSDNPNITGANSAETEAAFFWGAISNYVQSGGSYMVPMLDWEDTDATKANGFTNAATMSAWVNQFCTTISNYARAKGLTIRPVVYTGAWYARPGSTYPGLTTAVTNWPCNIAAYTSNFPQTGGPPDTFPWATWNFWQYANTNWSGGDSDVFNGTAAGLTNYIIGTNTSPPALVSSLSSRYADRGAAIKFSVQASGALPLRYQWRFNGTNIAGATTNTYNLANIQTNHAGNYTLVVTNGFGSITSSVATLTIHPLFAPVFSDDFDTNSTSRWTLNQSSSDARIAFAYNYSGYGIPSAPYSVGGSTKGVKFEVNVSLTNVAALNISPTSQNFGGNYRLHYQLWMNANGPFPAGGTGSTQYHTSGVGTSGNRVQWNTGTADGAWFAADGEGQAVDTSATLPDWLAYVGTTLQTTNSGFYAGGKDSDVRGNNHPYYENVFPGGQTAPATQSQTGGLDAGTIGFAWRDVVVNKTGSTVEWFIDGLKIAAVTNVSLIASNVFVGYWDGFASLSANTNLSFSLVDNLRVEVPAVAPTISTPPQNIASKITSNATFAVSANGTPSPTYQWQFNGTNLAGATSSSYTRTNVQPADAGHYSVVLTNMAGVTTSSAALLTILPAAPAQFQTLAVSPQSLQWQLQGDAGATYFVETSTNLVDWTAFTNLTLNGSAAIFAVTPEASGTQRYFRARSGP